MFAFWRVSGALPVSPRAQRRLGTEQGSRQSEWGCWDTRSLSDASASAIPFLLILILRVQFNGKSCRPGSPHSCIPQVFASPADIPDSFSESHAGSRRKLPLNACNRRPVNCLFSLPFVELIFFSQSKPSLICPYLPETCKAA